MQDGKSSRTGWTLIELLIALVIAVLIFVVLFSTYYTATSAVSGLQSREKMSHAAHGALTQLRDDLKRTFLAPADTTCLFSLTTDESGNTILSFCMTKMVNEENNLLWTDSEHVTYQSVKNADGSFALHQARLPLSGPEAFQPALTNILVEAMDGFRVEIYDGKTWQPQWPMEEDKHPMAARVSITGHIKEQSKTWETEIYIPAGNSFTSSYQRAGVTGASP